MASSRFVGLVALALGAWLPGTVAAQDLEFTLEDVEHGGMAPVAQPKAASAQPEKKRASVDDAIEHALAGLRWGMDKAAVLKVIRHRMRAHYDALIREEVDVMRQDALYQQARRRYNAIKRGFVSFDGEKTGWDVSPIAGEFRHGSHETMLVVDDDATRDHYFFINDRLWKWYRELKPAHFGRDFERISDTFQAEFGRGERAVVARAKGGPELETVRWNGRATRVSVVRRGGDTCLVFEARRTLKNLATLRKHALPDKDQPSKTLEAILMSEGEREQWRTERLRKTPAEQMAQRR